MITLWHTRKPNYQTNMLRFCKSNKRCKLHTHIQSRMEGEDPSVYGSFKVISVNRRERQWFSMSGATPCSGKKAPRLLSWRKRKNLIRT